MKILRVRRGYTTNSSGGNEWVPPEVVYDPNAPPPEVQPDPLVTADHVTILATQPGQVVPSPVNGRPADSGKTASNLGLMGMLVGAVCALFMLTAWLRKRFSKK